MESKEENKNEEKGEVEEERLKIEIKKDKYRPWKCPKCENEITVMKNSFGICTRCGFKERAEILPERSIGDLMEFIFRFPYILTIVFYYSLVIAVGFFMILGIFNMTINDITKTVTYIIILVGLVDLTRIVTDYHTKPLIISFFYTLWPNAEKELAKFTKETRIMYEEYAFHSLKIAALMILMETFIIIFDMSKEKQVTLEFDLFVLFSLLGVAAILFVLYSCEHYRTK